MPDDDAVSQELLDTYYQIISELEPYNDPEIIQPIINSFGYGLGYGLYQTARGILEKFSLEQLENALIFALNNGERGSRMWAANTLGLFRCERAIPYLRLRLNDPEEYVRSEAVSALGRMLDPESRELIEKMKNDSSKEVRSIVEIVLKLEDA